MITTQDVLNKKFSSSMFGYNKAEVDEFLNQIIDRMEADEKKSKDAGEELSTAQGQLKALKEEEAELKNTLVIAQKYADDIKEEAHRTAEKERAQAQSQMDAYKQQTMSEAQVWVLEQRSQIDAAMQEIQQEKAALESKREALRADVTELYRVLVGDLPQEEPVDKSIPKPVVEHFHADIKQEDEIQPSKDFAAQVQLPPFMQQPEMPQFAQPMFTQPESAQKTPMSEALKMVEDALAHVQQLSQPAAPIQPITPAQAAPVMPAAFTPTGPVATKPESLITPDHPNQQQAAPQGAPQVERAPWISGLSKE